MEFGLDLRGATSGTKTVYPDPSIEKLSTPYYTGGESYVFTTDPLCGVGVWTVTCAYKLTGTDNVVVCSKSQLVSVGTPVNALLKADADGYTP